MVQLRVAIVPPPHIVDEIDALRRELIGVLGALGDAPAIPLLLPVTALGNLTSPDARLVAAALREAFVQVNRPLAVRFAHPTVAADGSVRLGLAGGVEALSALARYVPVALEHLDLYVDRRRFWPGVVLGRTTAVLDALEAWEGSEWLVDHLTLLRGSGSDVTEYARLPLAA